MKNDFDKDKLKKLIFSILKNNFALDLALCDENYFTDISYDPPKTIKGLFKLGVIKSAGLVELKYKLFNEIESWLLFYKIPHYRNLDDFVFYLFNKRLQLNIITDTTQQKFTIKLS